MRTQHFCSALLKGVMRPLFQTDCVFFLLQASLWYSTLRLLGSLLSVSGEKGVCAAKT